MTLIRQTASAQPANVSAPVPELYSLEQIERCRYASGLYSAVPPDSSVLLDLYRSVWIRDTLYTLLAFEAIGDLTRLRAGVYALLDHVLLRWSYRLDWRIVKG